MISVSYHINSVLKLIIYIALFMYNANYLGIEVPDIIL